MTHLNLLRWSTDRNRKHYGQPNRTKRSKVWLSAYANRKVWIGPKLVQLPGSILYLGRVRIGGNYRGSRVRLTRLTFCS
jgi:hypothetical protein